MSNETTHQDKAAAGPVAAKATEHQDLALNNATTPKKTENTDDRNNSNENRHIYTVRVEFPLDARNTHDTFNAPVALRSLMEVFFQTATDLRALAHDDTKYYETMDQFPKDEEDFKKFHPTEVIKTKNNNTRILSSIRVSSTRTYEQLKADGMVHGYTHAQNVYIYWHPFKTLRLTKIGTFMFLSPSMTNRKNYPSRAIKHIIQWMTSVTDIDENNEDINELDLTSHDIPLFEISSTRTITHTMEELDKDNNPHNKKYSTLSLEVKCEIDVARKLSILLTESTANNPYSIGLFIPYARQRDDPAGFRDVILAQNTFLRTTIRCTITGIHPVLLAGKRVLGMDDTPDTPGNN
jgi:hypothetical protein